MPDDSIETFVDKDGNRVPLPRIISTLVKRGANVNHPDDEGRTPLHLAVMENRLSFVKYLLNNNANIYVRIENSADIFLSHD
jgi:ankyrin repeat protein